MKAIERTDARVCDYTKGSAFGGRKEDVFFRNILCSYRKDLIDVLYCRFCTSLSREDIEDIFQEACCIAWEKWNSSDFRKSEGGLKALLYLICRNIIGHSTRKRLYFDNIDEILERLNKDENDTLHHCFTEVDYNDDKYTALSETMKKLSETDKDILYFYYWENMKMEEIAENIGYKSPASVKSKKCKCIQKLKEMMLAAA